MSTTNRITEWNSLQQQNFNTTTRNMQQWNIHHSNLILDDIPGKEI